MKPETAAETAAKTRLQTLYTENYIFITHIEYKPLMFFSTEADDIFL